MTTSTKTPRATDVEVEGGRLKVELEDGREVSVPLSWFPRLERAGEQQRRNWSWIGPGIGIHWPDIDEHVSVESLLHPERTVRARDLGDPEDIQPRRGEKS